MESNSTTTILVAVLVGILSSLAASGLFVIIMSNLRPQLTISPKIARTISGGNLRYRIKVINKTRTYLINVRAELAIVTSKVIPGGYVLSTRKIRLITSELMMLPRFDEQDKDAKYAFRFGTSEDLDLIWQDEELCYMRFRILATHSLSGFSRLFEQEYRTKRNSLQDGTFNFGNDLEIS